jgi:TetR/AcrR family transcriptional regulator, cholesterol catabolism regulator
VVETRRDQIESVAGSLFRERGYPGTSVRDIARALDMQGASLYAHVASKEDVLWSIVQRAADRFEQAADAAEDATRRAPHPERLRALVRAHVGVVTDNVENASAFVYEWKFLSPERRASIRRRRDRYEGRFRSLISEGVAARAFGRVDPAVATIFILTSLNGIPIWYRQEGRLSADRIANELAELAVRSVEAHR